VFKLKKNELGAVIKHKARLVARGFVQQEGIDYDDAFAPVARMESVRVLLALAAQEGWRVHHMDVKSVFLNGDLKEEVYVQQPPGYTIAGEEEKVYRLRKALYGLWQAPRAWNAKLDNTLKALGFQQSAHEAAMYRRGSGRTVLLVGVYVDDLIITGAAEDEVEAFKAQMKIFDIATSAHSASTSASRCTRMPPGSLCGKLTMPRGFSSWGAWMALILPTLPWRSVFDSARTARLLWSTPRTTGPHRKLALPGAHTP